MPSNSRPQGLGGDGAPVRRTKTVKSAKRKVRKKKTGPSFIDLLKEGFLPAKERAKRTVRRRKR